MTDYCVYIFGPDGHISNRIDFFCDDDRAARKCAKQLVNGHDIELWQGARKLARFRHKPRDDSQS